MQKSKNILNHSTPSQPGDSTLNQVEEEIIISSERYELRLTQNDMLALMRAATIAMDPGVTAPLDAYEKELLNEFLEGAKKALVSPGTFVHVENNDDE